MRNQVLDPLIWVLSFDVLTADNQFHIVVTVGKPPFFFALCPARTFFFLFDEVLFLFTQFRQLRECDLLNAL